eukprot:PLAT6231.1.p1 GENE.PLAT6231.1~~PLAT6231.1.p1  ORF type:complete len:200 (+),score=48.92 PLAT6231.1:51-602(+)
MVLEDEMRSLRGLWREKRALAHRTLSLVMVLCTALMMWWSLCCITRSESPIVVVLSGSMEPAFYRGDILFLNNPPEPVRVGDIVVYKQEGKDVPIVHRVLELHQKDGETFFLTKGDNNARDDRSGRIFTPGRMWLKQEDILGKAVVFLPTVGYVTVALNDYPILKVILIAGMAWMVLTNKEEA